MTKCPGRIGQKCPGALGSGKPLKPKSRRNGKQPMHKTEQGPRRKVYGPRPNQARVPQKTQTLWSNDGDKGTQPPRSEQSPDPSTDGRSLLETSVSRHKLYGPNNGYKASSRPEVNRAPTRVQRLQPPLDECVVSQLNRSTPGTQAGSRPDVKSSNQRTKIKVHWKSVKSSNDESKNK